MTETAAPSIATNGGVDTIYADSTAHALKSQLNGGSIFRIPQIIANGTAAMTTTLIGNGVCGTTVTVSATGTQTSDVIAWSESAAPSSPNGLLRLEIWPTTNNVNFAWCNPTAGNLTPVAETLNWSVVR
jgi:hypothetical protein